MLVDHAVVHAAGDEAATQVEAEATQQQATEPRFGAVAARALHPRLDQPAAVGAGHGNRAHTENDHRWRLLLLLHHYHGCLRRRLLHGVHDLLLLEQIGR